MKSGFSLSVLVLLFLATACAPQAELVRTKSELSDVRGDVKTSRDRVLELQKQTQEMQKRIDAIDVSVKGSVDIQKNMADYGAKTDQLSTDIQLLQGKLEENNFRIADLAQKLDDKSFKIAELSSRIEELEARLKSLAAGEALSGPTGTGDKKPAARALEPSEAYRQAMNDYNSGNYDLALAGFQNYLEQFPDASQSDRAQYWIAESHYAKKDYKSAIDAFSRVIKTYPKSDKNAGAKLKIGYSYLNENNKAKAREWLNRVIKEYPGTKEAALAKEKLRKAGK
jgi:tol-pal system protein YbgF